jgi:hypothetical protein
MSRYLVDRIEAHQRITVRTGTHVSRVEGGDWLEQVVVAGPDGEESIDANGMFVLIGGEPLTAGVEDWLRCDPGGYLMTGPALYAEADRSWWPLARDPLFLESSQPGLFVAGDVRHGSIKRVASAVGEGATSIALVHSYLATLDGDRQCACATTVGQLLVSEESQAAPLALSRACATLGTPRPRRKGRPAGVSSGAHVSIASLGEDQATLEAGFGGAIPLRAVRRPDEQWRLPKRRRKAGCWSACARSPR